MDTSTVLYTNGGKIGKIHCLHSHSKTPKNWEFNLYAQLSYFEQDKDGRAEVKRIKAELGIEDTRNVKTTEALRTDHDQDGVIDEPMPSDMTETERDAAHAQYLRDIQATDWLPEHGELTPKMVARVVDFGVNAPYAEAAQRWAVHYQTLLSERLVREDGAPSNWNLCQQLCPKALQILDWYHLMHHASVCAAALFGEKDACGALWRGRVASLAYAGNVLTLVRELEQSRFACGDKKNAP